MTKPAIMKSTKTTWEVIFPEKPPTHEVEHWKKLFKLTHNAIGFNYVEETRGKHETYKLYAWAVSKKERVD